MLTGAFTTGAVRTRENMAIIAAVTTGVLLLGWVGYVLFAAWLASADSFM